MHSLCILLRVLDAHLCKQRVFIGLYNANDQYELDRYW